MAAGSGKQHFFEKKRAKNFCSAGAWAGAGTMPMAQHSKSLFASFSSEKEALPGSNPNLPRAQPTACSSDANIVLAAEMTLAAA
jgi:hypothetical protein